MVGPFRTARGGMTHLLLAVDKFTKWIEAKPIKKLDGSTAVTFFQDIILRYGYPHNIITDNGQTSPREPLPASAAAKGSGSTSHLSPTHSPMGKRRGPAA